MDEECKPKVYKSEGDHAPDIVIDDKADVSRIAEDIAAGEHESNNKSSDTKSAGAKTNRLLGTSSLTAHSNSINGFDSEETRHRTAFSHVSPSYAACMYSQAQFLQQIAAQQYYNGLLNSRYGPFGSSHTSSLGSPNMSSPTYLSPFQSSGVYGHPWLSALHLDHQAKAAAAAGLAYHPLFMGLPSAAHAQISPNFSSPIDQFHHHMGSMSAGSFFNPSPLQSPDTGTPIAPLGIKVPPAPTLSLASLNLSMPNGANMFSHSGLGVSPSYMSAAAAAANLQQQQAAAATNHLKAMRHILMPTAPPSGATSFANCLNVVCGAGADRLNHANVAAKACCPPDPYARHCNGAGVCKLERSHRFGNEIYHQGVHDPLASTSALSRQQLKEQAKKTHIKKPLNAFMLYMKELRPSVMQEAGLKERQSAEINRILGRRWHSLTREEQQKYYDMAKKERQDHLQKYPTWSARDNYAIHKKKKRKRDKTHDNLEAKKCRARFGLDQQCKWCKHCRRKKKCLWFKETDSSSISDAIDASPLAQVSSTSHLEDEQGKSRDAAAPKCASAPITFKPEERTIKIECSDVQNGSPQGQVSSTTTASARVVENGHHTSSANNINVEVSGDSASEPSDGEEDLEEFEDDGDLQGTSCSSAEEENGEDDENIRPGAKCFKPELAA